MSSRPSEKALFGVAIASRRIISAIVGGAIHTNTSRSYPRTLAAASGVYCHQTVRIAKPVYAFPVLTRVALMMAGLKVLCLLSLTPSDAVPAPLSLSDAGRVGNRSGNINPAFPSHADALELFSCIGEDGQHQALYINQSPPNDYLYKSFGVLHPQLIRLYAAEQEIFNSQDEPSTIIQWKHAGGVLRLYIQRIMSSEAEVGTKPNIRLQNISLDKAAIQIIDGRNPSITCVASTVKEPTVRWTPPGKEWAGGTNIWNLQFMGLAAKRTFDLENGEPWPAGAQ